MSGVAGSHVAALGTLSAPLSAGRRVSIPSPRRARRALSCGHMNTVHRVNVTAPTHQEDLSVKRLNLQVDRILPLHGRIVPLAELQRMVGK